MMEELRYQLYDALLKNNAFWSYEKPSFEEVSDEALIEMAIVHLDVDDINKLFILFPKEKIREVWQERILSQEPYYHDLNYLMAWLYFDIEDPEKFIKYRSELS